MAKFTLIHLSDLHLARFSKSADIANLSKNLPAALGQGVRLSWLSSHSPAPLWAAASFVFERADADFVVVSGDLVTAGHEADAFQLAKTLLQGPPVLDYRALHPFDPHSLFPTLATGPRVIAIPGNHDRYSSNSAGVECRLYDSHLGWPGTARAVAHQETGLRIVSIDCTLAAGSTWSSWPHRLGLGEVTDQTVSDARVHSKRVDDDDLLFWIVHWPPEVQAASSWLRLDRESDLLALARELKVDLILSGHTHTPNVYLSSAGVPVACCGSTSQVLEAHSLFQIVVEKAPKKLVVSVERWEHDVSSSSFQLAGRWVLVKDSAGKFWLKFIPASGAK